MTALAPIGTVREIDRQSDFIRNFLKYDVIINVTEHNIFVQPPSALPEKKLLIRFIYPITRADNPHSDYDIQDIHASISYQYAYIHCKWYSVY